MRRRRDGLPVPDAAVTEAALEALDGDQLKVLMRDLLPWFDDTLYARFVNALVDRAARTCPGWAPRGPTDETVAAIEAFAATAQRDGFAEPEDVDAYLREGLHAFLGRDYRSAARIFRALLIPIGNADIDLGQHELIDEVVGVDVADCAAQYVVSVYMLTAPADRGEVVLAAIEEMAGAGLFWHPLRELERVAIEPLVDLDRFLDQWRVLVEARVAAPHGIGRATQEQHWLHEVVQRLEGVAGLARLARASARVDDLRAWHRVLVEAGDWLAALGACDEAAGLLADRPHDQADFLDGGALAAQQLGRPDLPARLEQAWRAAPNMTRLCRWLGSARSKAGLRGQVTAALAVCPEDARSQRGLLHVLDGDLVRAAALLAAADGDGWSLADHPGGVLFPLFASLFGVVDLPDGFLHDLEAFGHQDEPRLPRPALQDLITLAGIREPRDATTRDAITAAMRTAAEQCIAAVTGTKHRRWYGHAASLALTCARVDPSPATNGWLADLRGQYRRFAALQREFEARGGGR